MWVEKSSFCSSKSYLQAQGQERKSAPLRKRILSNQSLLPWTHNVLDFQTELLYLAMADLDSVDQAILAFLDLNKLSELGSYTRYHHLSGTQSLFINCQLSLYF